MRVGNDRIQKAAIGKLRLCSCVVSCLGAALAALTSSAGTAAAQTPGEPSRVVGLRADPSYLDLSAGVWDIIGNAHRNETGVGGAEFRFGGKILHIGPAAGILADLHGGGMAYAGFYGDIPLGPVIVTPLAGFGVWWRGGGNDEDLGGPFEFRLSLQAAYQFADRSRLGLRFGHISNADTRRKNPGENDLMLTFAWPLDF